MYRGRVSDANLAVDNGWYEIFGDISNAPFTQSWGPLFVIGNSYKVQFAFYSVSDGFKLYVRQLNHTNFGWAKIDLTQVLEFCTSGRNFCHFRQILIRD